MYFFKFFLGLTTTKVLAALDALDRHRFDRVDTTNSLDTLYAKIFPAPTAPIKDPTSGSPPGANTNTSSSSSSSNENKESRNEYVS